MDATIGFPWPAGTYVRCIEPTNGQPARSTCKGHIFKTFTDPIPSTFGCGFIQSARCVVCNYTTPLIDADFWHDKVTPFDVAGCMGEVHEIIDWMTNHVMPELERAFMGQTPAAVALKDFD